jgi:hypothetical protein
MCRANDNSVSGFIEKESFLKENVEKLQQNGVNPASPSSSHCRIWAFIRLPLITIAAFVLLEALIFRTGFYISFLEPISSTGQFEGAFRDERNRAPAAPNEILVMGDSRAAEGFSSKAANSVFPGREYYFASVAVPGATPRCWYYMLRDLDPTRKRYRAIILPVASYDDTLEDEDASQRLADMHYVIARLGYADIFEFASSFSSYKDRLEVIRNCLFKGIVFQSDVIAFMENARKRLSSVAYYQQYRWKERYEYAGHREDMSELYVDWAQKTIRFPARISALEQSMLKYMLFEPRPPQTGALGRYRRLWFGRIIELYRNSNTDLIFLALPRGPAVRPPSDFQPPSQVIRDFGKSRGVILLPDTLFSTLEKPEFYFDIQHLNSLGREQFSNILAKEIQRVLGPGSY